jgi:16S rRNA (guanine(1405)-N(7))-methyltransferase
MRTAEVDAIVASIKGSKNYRDTYEGTIRALVEAAMGKYKKQKDVEKAARRQLHQIMAPYVGDPDYEEATEALRAAFASASAADDPGAVRATCAEILRTHVSTQERLAVIDHFYPRIFQVTGKPTAIMDIACALNPLTFPWMGLPTTTRYYAYDIHETRVAFLNTFFELQGLPPLAKLQDVGLTPPTEVADVAFFLKELHRFEQHYSGVTVRRPYPTGGGVTVGRPCPTEGGVTVGRPCPTGLTLLKALRARYLVVSFPTVSLHGGRSLTDHYREYFQNLIADTGWRTTELLFETELVFCVEK